MRRRRKHRKIKIGSKESHISLLKSFKSSLILPQYKNSQFFLLEKLVKTTTILVFLSLCPIQPKCHCAQVDFDIVFLTNVFLTKGLWDILTNKNHQFVNLTTNKLSHHYLRFDLCHILSSLYYIFEGDNIVCCKT
jgi:NADH:ubiquinone oxidoreductase subunit H